MSKIYREAAEGLLRGVILGLLLMAVWGALLGIARLMGCR